LALKVPVVSFCKKKLENGTFFSGAKCNKKGCFLKRPTVVFTTPAIHFFCEITQSSTVRYQKRDFPATAGNETLAILSALLRTRRVKFLASVNEWMEVRIVATSD
jgi:hypothetical protein